MCHTPRQGGDRRRQWWKFSGAFLSKFKYAEFFPLIQISQQNTVLTFKIKLNISTVFPYNTVLYIPLPTIPILLILLMIVMLICLLFYFFTRKSSVLRKSDEETFLFSLNNRSPQNIVFFCTETCSQKW